MPARRIFPTFLACLLAAATADGQNPFGPGPRIPPAPATASGAPAPVAAAPAGYEGAIGAGLALRALGQTGRVLHIAAHPDDENTALIATLALGHGVDVAYLSLTRGEGGQNSIGPELSTALGVIRGEELVSARRLDGGEQFFARAIDYGYSKNADEAFRQWPKDELLADVVEVIRRWRPDVVVSVWSGTSLDGHGQHQASGIVSREAVLAAGDPARFPEQITAGLRPHRPALYYRSAFFSDRAPDVELNTGRLDPLLGLSYHQVAMASRGLHRSQDQGLPRAPGPRRTSFHLVDPAADEPVGETRQFDRHADGAPTADRSIFAGVDTLLSQRADRAARLAADRRTGDARRILAGAADGFREYERLVADARREFSPLDPGRVLPALTRAQHRLVAVAATLEAAGGRADPDVDHAARDLLFHLAAELDDLRRALLAAANVAVDVVADREWIVPGQEFRLELSVWNGSAAPVRARIGPHLPAGWSARAVSEGGTAAAGDEAVVVAPGDRAALVFRVAVPDDAAYTAPYYLDPRAPPGPGDAMYTWPDDPEVRTLPAAPVAVRGSFHLVLDGGNPIAVERDATRTLVDRRAGEFRRPVKVVPRASLAVEPDLIVVPLETPLATRPASASSRARAPSRATAHASATAEVLVPDELDADQRATPRAGAVGNGRSREVTVRVRSNAPEALAGELVLEPPAGWSVRPDRVPVRLERAGEERTVTFEVAPPAGLAAGEHEVRAAFEIAGRRHDLGFQVVDYPHIEPTHVYRLARVRVRALELQVAPVRVGYIAAAGDGVPEALDRMGVEWESIDDRMLAGGDLARFDAIVVGVRAYELRPALVAHNGRLLDWTRDGGTLIVQYQQYAAVGAGFAPWPVTIARPHGRVTDATAEVTVLEPDHPVLTGPNPIGPADWEGWVQERGLYFLDSWDGPLIPLLSMSDPGEDPLSGALLTAPLSEGTWVYTGLALFRQLPEGVPGAYRLLANLLSLPAAR